MHIGIRPFLAGFSLRTKTTGGENPIHLDTITELLNIPNHKAAGVIKSGPKRSYMILERIREGKILPYFLSVKRVYRDEKICFVNIF